MPAFVTCSGIVKNVAPRKTEKGAEYHVMAIEVEPGMPLICAEVWSKKVTPNIYKDRRVVIAGEAWMIDSKAPGVRKTLSLSARHICETDADPFLALSVTGKLGRDPEIKYTEGGLCITSFSLATDRMKQASWWEMVAFKRDAENIGNYTKKGSLLGVSHAILKWDSWEKEGQRQCKLKGTVNAFELMGGKRNEESAAFDLSPEEIF